MGNWSGIQNALASVQPPSSRLGGLASVISKVATRLKQERESGQELEGKKNLLGYAGLMEGKIEKAQEGEQGAMNVPGVGWVKPLKELKEWKPKTREEALDFEKTKRQIDYADIPPGFVTVGGKVYRDPSYRVESPQDKKVELELEDRKRANRVKSDSVIQSANDTLDTIKEVEKRMDAFGMTGNIPTVPGFYSRKNWESNIDKLKSKLILDVMKNMKEASKTGATGFGQLNLEELKVLKDSSTALKKDLSPQDAQRYLNVIKGSAEKILQGSNSRGGQSAMPTPQEASTAKAQGFTGWDPETGWVK